MQISPIFATCYLINYHMAFSIPSYSFACIVSVFDVVVSGVKPLVLQVVQALFQVFFASANCISIRFYLFHGSQICDMTQCFYLSSVKLCCFFIHLFMRDHLRSPRHILTFHLSLFHFLPIFAISRPLFFKLYSFSLFFFFTIRFC